MNGGSLAGAFAKQAEVLESAVRMLQAQCFILPFMGYYILAGMLLQNIGKFGLATCVTVAESGTVFIPVLLIGTYLFGAEGIIYSKPVASVISLVLSLVIGTYAWNKYLKERNDEIHKNI